MMYDLHSLGWHSFQQLCLTVCREVLGQTVESFLPTADAGQDGAFSGSWKRQAKERLNGAFVIQCKFTSKRDINLRAADLADEMKKVKKLVRRGLCDSYILMTNAGVAGAAAVEIKAALKTNGVKHTTILAGTWICDQIRERKRLRMMVPRIYGLGDLSQILDDRAYRQAKALLASLRDDLSKVVITSAYRRAVEALDQHGFVLLIGEPAAGKTTIASMLAVAALDQWGCSTLKLDDAGQVIKHWNTDEPSQFFWVDDAFGVMQYESHLVHRWNHAFGEVRAMLHQGCKIVMTSRDYIYRRARNELKDGAFPLLRESQVVIDVHDLTPEERQQILYNHIRLGKQTKKFRRAIKPHLKLVAQHRRFIPETARRLGEPLFTKDLELDEDEIDKFVEKQERLLREIITGLDEHSKAALALIYMRSGALESPIVLEPSERQAIERLASDLGRCTIALDCLQGSLVQYVQTEDAGIWRFKHPTVGDAFASLLLKNPEWLGIYVHGSPPDQLMSQITCGDVGLERAVVVPKNLFPLVRKRLAGFCADRRASGLRDPRSRVDGFLSYRCSKDFLKGYIEDRSVLERIADPGLALDASSEVDLAIQLHKFGLLPEQYRKAFVDKVMAYAFEGDDFYGLENQGVQSVFTADEIAAFRQRVRDELIPNLFDVTWHWKHDFLSDRSPEDMMQPLLESYESLKKQFSDDPALVRKIEGEIDSVNEWIAEKAERDPPREREPRVFGEVNAPEPLPTGPRSIFDDVDG
jgi:hypothetical protein